MALAGDFAFPPCELAGSVFPVADFFPPFGVPFGVAVHGFPLGVPFGVAVVGVSVCGIG